MSCRQVDYEIKHRRHFCDFDDELRCRPSVKLRKQSIFQKRRGRRRGEAGRGGGGGDSDYTVRQNPNPTMMDLVPHVTTAWLLLRLRIGALCFVLKHDQDDTSPSNTTILNEQIANVCNALLTTG